MRIFGREPAAVIAAIQALLVMALAFGWLQPIGLNTQDDIMVMVGVLNAAAAVFLAYKTSETLLAPVIELFKAVLAAFAIYGFHLTTDQTAAVIAAITMAFGLFQRTQVTPLVKGNFEVVA